jgi:ATP-dependent helicase/nuclease subunit A
MDELREADARARAAALDVTRSFIVQAPAGSGKTELLVCRFLALLATVTAPESVLAVTFTRKAAAEMRARILRVLRAAAGDEPNTDQLPLALELARGVFRVDRERGWDLVGNPGRLRIQTIDSLNYGLARRLPVLSGLGAGLGVEEDARELYRTAAERLLEHLPGGEPLHARAVATLLSHLDNRVSRFVALVVEMLARRDAWGPLLPQVTPGPEATAALRSRLEAARTALVAAHFAGLVNAFDADRLREAAGIAHEAAGNLVAAGSDSAITAWRASAMPPGHEAGAAPLWQGLAELLLTTSGTPRQKPNRNQGVPPGPAGAPLRGRLQSLAQWLASEPGLGAELHAVREIPAPTYEPGEWTVLEAQLVVLRLAAAELELVFAERRVADYPRIAAAARQSLGSEEEPTDTALALDASLSHVLVDEFQDTSRAQVDLLEGLTAGWVPGDGRTVFLVGDPMQSIYRFRGAEVGLYLEVRDRGLGQVALTPLTLSVNFRSTEPLIEWVNDCFVQVLPRHDDEVTGAVRYAPCRAAPGAGSGGGVRVHALLRRSRKFEAAQVADVVARRLADDDRADVAILVQGRRHLFDIVAELARRGVPFQATDIDPLGERPLVLDLLSLTRAMSHPADRPAWLSVLRAPWCGLELESLHALCGDEPDATVPELLADAGRRRRLDRQAQARLQRAWTVLERAPDELRRHGLTDAVHRAWLALGGPATAGSLRELDEAQAYLEALAQLERKQRGPAELGHLRETLAGLYAPSRPDRTIRVQLLTVHKAKGLQFDTVIVPGLERRGRADDKRLLQWVRLPDAGPEGLVVAPVARTGAEPNRLYRWLERLEAERLAAERRRLLYVAATRARRWLHLFGTCAVRDAAEERPTLVKPAAGVALGALWPVLERNFTQRLEEAGAIEGEAPQLIPRDPPLGRLPLAWTRPLPAAPRLVSSAIERGSGEAAVLFDWASETARRVGTVVHRELLRMSRGADPQLSGGRARRRYLSELAELGVPLERRAAAVEQVAVAVERTLEDGRGRWLLDSGHREAASELPLSGPVDGKVVSVVIDRTFVDQAGTRWIVDYKTSVHEGAGLDEFLDREQARYAPQLARYATLVRRLGPEPVQLGLYFPLLGAWRTWS